MQKLLRRDRTVEGGGVPSSPGVPYLRGGWDHDAQFTVLPPGLSDKDTYRQSPSSLRTAWHCFQWHVSKPSRPLLFLAAAFHMLSLRLHRPTSVRCSTHRRLKLQTTSCKPSCYESRDSICRKGEKPTFHSLYFFVLWTKIHLISYF